MSVFAYLITMARETQTSRKAIASSHHSPADKINMNNYDHSKHESNNYESNKLERLSIQNKQGKSLDLNLIKANM